MAKVTLFKDVGFGNPTHYVDGDTSNLPPNIRNEASSIEVNCPTGWVVFYESVDYEDDELWVECPLTDPQKNNLMNLHTLKKANGGHWGDEIASIAFSTSGPESGDEGDRTILYRDGRVVIDT